MFIAKCDVDTSFKSFIWSNCLLYQNGEKWLFVYVFLKKNNRSDNTYAQLKNKNYVRLVCFLVDRLNKVEYTIVKKIDVQNVFVNNCKMMKQIITSSSDESSIMTNEIDKVCIHMKVNNIEYLCAVPNLKCL